jgi:hypothetical protein
MSDFFSKILAVFPKEVRDNWVLIILLIIGGMYFMNYLNMKGSYGTDMMSGNDQAAYKKQGGSTASSGAKPAEDIDGSGNGSFAPVNGVPSNGGMPSSCSKPNMQNPADLLPKDNNSQWAQLNPAGKGEFANTNFLKAGYHIGIDTIGQTLRNANLQIRSEPDFMRPPLEVGQGVQ